MTAQRAQAATCARWQKLAQDSTKPRHGALGVHVRPNKATPHERRANHFFQINKQKNKPF
ncbi:hypothetical protein EBQ26_00605 [Allofranklinella schreckenbergeri]|uniref:Uncharacterized protein n=1 Tax=Allofranklinella schreckenbergeri TaxID=1076744 RepID=A0A3M6QFW0_9BURK|nr:hypothetical protein [Allofranklinella schreckenbergeri]RMX01319.1 hypothetical protein EBQ26_00605 [Allofranklinella schreckenbergeri]